ncbi:MAG: hypothetical protein LBG25_03115 [Spirochaetaceae bacterium]|nr:hypothetical protein [Spirochaetaceae bacterium]
MPWRLIGFVFFLGILLVFIGLNLNNSCDISFGFTTIKAVPIYLTVFSAFVLGLFCTLPVIVTLKFRKSKPRDTPAVDAGAKKNRKSRKKQEPEKGDNPPAGDGPRGFLDGNDYGIN